METQGLGNILRTALIGFLSDITADIISFRWFILAAFALSFVEIRFKIAEKRLRKKRVSVWKETYKGISTFADYICWLFIAGSIGRAFGEPFGLELLTACILAIIYGVRLTKCFNEYFKACGSNTRINIFNWLGSHYTIFQGLIVDDEYKNKKENETNSNKEEEE